MVPLPRSTAPLPEPPVQAARRKARPTRSDLMGCMGDTSGKAICRRTARFPGGTHDHVIGRTATARPSRASFQRGEAGRRQELVADIGVDRPILLALAAHADPLGIG